MDNRSPALFRKALSKNNIMIHKHEHIHAMTSINKQTHTTTISTNSFRKALSISFGLVLSA